MLYCSIQPHRERKCRMVMEALDAGWGEPAQVIDGDPPEDGHPFAVYGQVWGAERLLPKAIKCGRPYWYIDNGFHKPGRGSPEGYYRICYRSMMSVYLPDASDERARATSVAMKPWRKDGRHILFALPGPDYGQALGLSMPHWIEDTRYRLRQVTSRPVIERDKSARVSLADQLKDCWVLVTHSSNAAVEAVIAGVPVFVAAGAAAAPVGKTDLAEIENPSMPDNRDQWWCSLMCQQFNVAEMADGTAFSHLARVREIVDGQLAAA